MLNIQQQKVVKHQGSLVNIAGPGSGKTHTLISKISKILEKNEIKLENLLVLTFTNAAANEIKERALKQISYSFDTKIYFGTYHSIFKRLLVEENVFPKIGLSEHPTITMPKEIERAFSNLIKNTYLKEQEKISNIAIKNNYKHIKKPMPQNLSLTKTIIKKELINGAGILNTINDTINQLKIKDIENVRTIEEMYEIINKKTIKTIDNEIDKTIEKARKKIEENNKKEEAGLEVKEADKIFFSNSFGFTTYELLLEKKIQKQQILNKISNIIQKHINNKIDQNIISFGDIMALTLYSLTKIETFRNKMKEKFKKIFVDEFQDTNIIQSEILYLLQNKDNICVIGDPYQSIYYFLGARIKNILEASYKFEAETIQLTQNYRSNQNIVELTNYIGKNMIEKIDNWIPCESANKQVKNNKIKLKNNMEEEAQAKEVIEIIKQYSPKTTIGIINRTGNVFMIENELKKSKFKYDKLGGESIGESIEIKMLINLYIYILNDNKIEALINILEATPGIGKKSIEDYEKELEKDKIEERKIPKKINIVLNELFDIKKIEDLSEKSKAIENYYFKNLFENLAKTWKSERETEAQEKLKILLEEIKELENPIQIIALLEEYLDGSKEKPKDLKERITVTTIHSAKGLEWDVVILLNWGNKSFARDNKKEAQRLAYVAISRAKENLYILSNEPSYMEISEDFIEKSDIFEIEKIEKQKLLINFGKYKGTEIEDLPFSYLEWLYDNKEDLLKKRFLNRDLLMKIKELLGEED